MRQLSRPHLPTLIFILCAILHIVSCTSSSYTFSSKDELFKALDAGTQKWKTLYDNADPSVDKFTNRLESIVRQNRDKILESVDDGPIEHRIVAAKSLQFLRVDKNVLEKIYHALEDSNPTVRKHALFALGYIRPDWSSFPKTLTRIKKQIKTQAKSNHDPVRSNAYYAMFGLVTASNDRGFLALLKNGLTDPELSVRNQAVRTFQVLQAPGAVPLLIEHTLHDSSDLVRFNTLRALRNQNDRRAVPELVGMLKNADTLNPFFVRRTTNLLQEITGERDKNTPEDWVRWHKLEKMIKKPVSSQKAREVVSKMFLFLKKKQKTDELTGYTTRIIRQKIQAILNEVTGEGTRRTLLEWVRWYQNHSENDTPLPVKRENILLPRLLKLLSSVRNQNNELTELLIRGLKRLAGIYDRSQMDTPGKWLNWYQKHKSKIDSRISEKTSK